MPSKPVVGRSNRLGRAKITLNPINKAKQSIFHLNKFHWSLILINFSVSIIYIIVYFVVLTPEAGASEWKVFMFNITPVISIGATIANLFCTILLSNRRIQNFYFGIVAVILFAIIGVLTRNWLIVILNGGYYLVFNILGIFQWKKHMGRNAEVVEKSIKTKKTFFTIIFGAIILGVTLSFTFAIPAVKSFLGDTEKSGWAYWIKLVLNGTSLMLCVFAMQLALRAYKEQWNLWMIANFSVLLLWTINIVEFAESNDSLSLATSIFTLFTYTLSTANSIYGYINWKKK